MKLTAHQALHQLIDANDWALKAEKISPAKHQAKAEKFQLIADKLAQYEAAFINQATIAAKAAQLKETIKANMATIEALILLLNFEGIYVPQSKHLEPEKIKAFFSKYPSFSFDAFDYSQFCNEIDLITALEAANTSPDHKKKISNELNYFILKK